MKYDLKGAIMDLGPTGFPFEKFASKVLQNYGYETSVGKELEGKCVTQEVDVSARKGSENFLVECKFHNDAGIITGLKVMMYTRARFLDLKEKFNRVWLICNTKISGSAKKYAECTGVKVTSWNYPEENNLKKLIERKKLYPVTILKSVDSSIAKKLFEADIVLTKSLIKQDLKKLEEKKGFSKDLLDRIKKDAKELTPNMK